MLAADADLEIGARLAAARHADLDEFTDAIAIDRDERIDLEDTLADVGAKEARSVVAADAVGGLRQVVGAEREELRGLRDVAGHQARARKLDHGANLIGDLLAGFLHHGLRGGVDPRLDQVELGLRRDQRHHHLEANSLAGALFGLDRCLEDRARLHLGDFRVGDGETAAAEAQHRVELGEIAGAIGELARIGVHRPRDLLDLGLGVRQELVQRRIEQTDGDRQALHDLEQLDEIGALHRQQLRQRRAARLLVFG